MPAGRVIVVGSLNLDLVVAAEALPAPGETVLGADLEIFEGGKGANQAVAAARAGASVRFVGCVGDDAFGERGRAAIAAEGIDGRFLTIQRGVPTGVALIGIDRCGQNAILVSPGANARLTPELVTRALEDVGPEDVVLCQLEVPLESVAAALSIGRSRGARTLLDPAPARPDGLTELLRDCWLVTPNEGEAEILWGTAIASESDLLELAGVALRSGPEIVVVTCGERGALACTGEEPVLHLAAPAVQAVDTTAAGDAFAGALAAALAGGVDWRTAARAAVRYAARSVERRGAQASLPRWSWSEAVSAADVE